MFPQNVENWGISDKKEMENTNECLESLLVFSVHVKCSREKTPRSSWVWRSFKTFMFLAYADDCLLYYLQVVRGCSDTVIWAIKNLASPVATINIDSEKLGFNIWCRNSTCAESQAILTNIEPRNGFGSLFLGQALLVSLNSWVF